ncbi:single-stranded DNA-binding protein [Cellulosilyticum sp. I15G10I2]|uniref:single-stranded DNA-binding protein n=1 Tax=Cellulosilyticum sp. I15G10I2 TaxID=1892843 RepID=UPI00085C4904|nr:single-stranded DNA-binding protein [Cellulosilyticum sp. I15G10I2]
MNQVNLVGNVTHNLELKQSQQEIKYTQFRLAVDDKTSKEKRTNFIDIVAFGRQAEILTQHVEKGEKLFVSGRLTSSKFVNPEGNKISKIKVILEAFEFTGNHKSLAQANVVTQNA